jgi:anti-anti-sigma factor
MNFTEKQKKDITIIKIELEQATILNSRDFKIFLFDSIDKGNKKILVDLSRCKKTDSTFMGTLVAGKKYAESKGGEVALIITEEIVSVTFIISRMDKVFNIFNAIKAGLEHFS